MMLLLKEIGNQRIDLNNDTILAYNSKNRLIHYQVQNSKQLKLPMEVMLEQDYVDIRNDLLNPGVAICTAEIPLLFSENFDCQTLNDLIQGLLVNEEIAMKTVYCEVLSDGQYMAKANNWPMYQIISRDVIRRWSYPLVPDLSERYSYRKNSIYLKNVTFSKDCKLGFDVVIGNNTRLNKNVSIDNSVIGSDCQIGERVTIENSYIFDGVRIDSGSIVRYSVIGEKCHVRKNCVVDKNCLLGPGVELKEKAKYHSISLVSDKYPGTERFSKYSNACFQYRTSVDSSDSEDEDVPCLPTELLVKDLVFEEDEESSESDSECVVPVDDVKTFYNEVIDSLKRGYNDKLNCENLILEINSSRYAYNITVNEVNFNLVRAVLNIGLDEMGKDVKKVLQHTVSKLKYFLPLMRNYIKNDDAQIDCLSALEDVMSTSPSVLTIASKILQFLYDKDILCEEQIVRWYEKLVADGMEEMTIRLAPFIEWLKEAEEESEDSS
jgi:translation initiation factor eIF-2B subunit epsilon